MLGLAYALGEGVPARPQRSGPLEEDGCGSRFAARSAAGRCLLLPVAGSSSGQRISVPVDDPCLCCALANFSGSHLHGKLTHLAASPSREGPVPSGAVGCRPALYVERTFFNIQSLFQCKMSLKEGACFQHKMSLKG